MPRGRFQSARARLVWMATADLGPQGEPPDPGGQFAKQLSDPLNHTITDGVRLKSLLLPNGETGWVGFRIAQAQPFPGEAIPIGWRGAPARCWLHVGYTLHQDPGRYLTVSKSTYALRLGGDAASQALPHYDFNRDPTSDYPEAHVQVPGSSRTLQELGRRFQKT